jgi:capsular exopolysaccharide synthesis family protein
MAAEAQPRVPTDSASGEFDFQLLVRLLVQQKWVILGVFVTVMAATVFGTLSTTKLYEASATLEYDPTPPRPLGSEVEDVAAPAGNFLASKEWYQTQNAIIASRTVARKVVERLGLHRDPDFMGVSANERASWHGVPVEEAIKELSEALTVKQERDTRVAKVSVRSTSAERAALLANSIAESYMDWMMEERLGSTVRAVEWLSGQLDDISKRLESSELALYDFRKKNNVLSVSLRDQQNGVSETIHSFGAALTDATTRRIQLRARVNQLEEALNDDPMKVHVSLVSASAAMGELRRRYHDALVERDSLAIKYGPNHPDMRSVQEKIDAIVAAARSEILGLVQALKADLREVEEEERGLREARQRTQNVGLDLNLHEIDFNRMERERANNEKLHTLLLQRTTETNLTRMLRVSPVRLVDRAVVPDQPIRPRPLMNVAIGLVVGLLGGFGAAVLRTRMDRSVNTPDDVAMLGATVLGLVPTIAAERTPAPTGGSAARKRKQVNSAERASKDLVVHTHPRSAVAECCRTIRTNLTFMSTDKPLRAMLVTSPGPAEGKSTLTISLAITVANSGRRVLLVDTDLRRPRIHKAFNVVSPGGVTSILAGEVSIDDSVQSCAVDNLSILPCGPIPPNPSELLHTAKFAQLMRDLKDKFDLVIFDSPPVGVVIDAAIIGPQVDGAIIVAESGRTSRDALAHALRQMRDVGTNVLGCVLNDVDLAKHGSYGGYYYYSGGYYYASTDENTGGGPSLSGGSQVSPPAE